MLFFLIFHITSFYFCKTYHTFIKVHKTHWYRLTNNYKANTHVTTIQIKKHSRSPFPHIPPVVTPSSCCSLNTTAKTPAVTSSWLFLTAYHVRVRAVRDSLVLPVSGWGGRGPTEQTRIASYSLSCSSDTFLLRVSYWCFPASLPSDEKHFTTLIIKIRGVRELWRWHVKKEK